MQTFRKNSTATANRWKTSLFRNETAIIEAACRNVLKEFGYKFL